MYGLKLTVWQVVLIGCVWIAIGVGLGIVLDVPAPNPLGYRSFFNSGLYQIIYALKPWTTVPVGLGLFHFYAARATVLVARRRAAEDAAAEAAKRPPVEAAPPPKPRPSQPLPPPPNVETDPFRAPPQPAPLAIVRAGTEPAAPKIVPGDPDDKPKFLG